MSTMYVPASGHRPPGRPTHRRTQSDPAHSYVNPPYTVRWPVPARTPTPYPHFPPSTVPIVDPFVQHSGPFPARRPTSNARARPPTLVSPRSPSPQRPGYQRSASARHGSTRAKASGSPIGQQPRSVHNVPSAVTAPHSLPEGWGQARGPDIPDDSQSPLTPTLIQSTGTQRQGSRHAVYPQSSSAYQSESTSGAHLLYHASTRRHHHQHQHPLPSTTHHVVQPRSRPRNGPPSAASHRYASNITHPVYGHGSSTTSNTSRTSLNDGVASQRHLRAPSLSPSPAPSISHHNHHQGTGSTHVPSGPPLQRLPSHTRASSTSGSIAPSHSVHKLEKISPTHPLAASEIHRHPERPALPANYDGQTQTRYVDMLLALDDISPFFNVLSWFFTWILLAGFVLLPGTFVSLQNEPAGSPETLILAVVNHLPLYVIAFLCTGIGACGMIWLWWRWHGNYIWITNRIFVPGCLNSLAGLISSLSSIYGAQGGVLGRTEKSALIVTGSLSVICGTLFFVYEHWFIRNLKLEHDQEVGVELAGKYGEGILVEKDTGA